MKNIFQASPRPKEPGRRQQAFAPKNYATDEAEGHIEREASITGSDVKITRSKVRVTGSEVRVFTEKSGGETTLDMSSGGGKGQAVPLRLPSRAASM